MKARVVTVSIQMGSGGEEVAMNVAKRLRFRYYNRAIVSHAAEIAGVSPETIMHSEQRPGLLERMLENLGLTAAVTDSMLLQNPESTLSMTSVDYRSLVEKIVNELAERGSCVIAGHAGQVLLKDRPDVLKVLIHGTPDERAIRLASDQGVALDEAKEAVERSDTQRIEFFRHIYDADWLSPTLYDLALGTDRMDLDQAAQAIIGACRSGRR